MVLDEDVAKGLEQAYEFSKQLKEYNEQIEKKSQLDEIQKRGIIITQSIIIEELINKCLTTYFISGNDEKRSELYHLILCSEAATFMHKYRALQFIWEEHFNDFNIKYNSSKKNNLNPKLQEFIELRNKFAHRSSINFENKSHSEKEVLVLAVKGKKTDNRRPLFDKLIIDENKLSGLRNDFEFIKKALEELQDLIYKSYREMQE